MSELELKKALVAAAITKNEGRFEWILKRIQELKENDKKEEGETK